MAIVKETIKQELIQLTEILKNQTDQEQGIEDWSDGLADIIVNALLSAEVVQVNTNVSTVTVGTSPSGPTSGTGTGTGTQTGFGALQ